MKKLNCFKCEYFRRLLIVFSFMLPVLLIFSSVAQENNSDTRHEKLIDADHFELRLKPVKSLEEWELRKKELREMLLLRAGLWPLPEKMPLNAKIFDVRQGDGFTVAKVYYESLPGFLATGNLYKPTKGKGPFPAVICPHGHWKYGRLQNSEQGSIPGRCIDFARQGFVVFSIDMVGYYDSFQMPHDPNKSRAQLKSDEPQPYEPRIHRGDFDFPEAELYGFNPGGLQLWNNIRGVDFLSSLPDVDKSRIGATGASGGATQTILLMVADDRIKAAAPVNIIGAGKHPGCLCENIPGIWLEMSTVELSAAFSPRPLLLMSATEDPWTHSTPEREYPLIKKYYSLYNADDMIKNVHIKAGHNYNADTRAAVYDWFCKHLKSPVPPIRNPVPVSDELKSLGDLRVFPDKMLPENALTWREIIANWKAASEKVFTEQLPHSRGQFRQFADTFGKKLELALAVDSPLPEELNFRVKSTQKISTLTFETVLLGRKGKWDSIEIESISQAKVSSGNILVVYPDDEGGFFFPDNVTRKPWVETLLEKGYRVFRIRGYASGRLFIPDKVMDSLSWFSAYNRSNELNGIQDIVTALKYLEIEYKNESLAVAGLKECGLLTAFACAVSGNADRVVVDMNRCDPGYDGELVKLLPVGGIKRAGDFRTAMLLLMQKPVTLYNAGPTFDGEWYTTTARKIGLDCNLDLRLSERVLIPIHHIKHK